MKYKYNDRITLENNKIYPNNEHVSAGTKGTVIMVYPQSEAYMILFDAAKIPHKVAEIDLIY